ncbi:50S ribosomal protein L6 [candidate division WWE3 bacterium]|nr:50S ribosomal protein L6 [candidate division WWE3 bacterium]
MSRIGALPIQVPEEVRIDVTGQVVVVHGPRGSLSIDVRPEIRVVVDEKTVRAEVKKKALNTNAYWGLTRALIANMVKGVSGGFEKRLDLEGVGYRVKGDKGRVELSVGFSHPVEYVAPEGIEFELIENKSIVVKGIDKQLVGLVASKIRKIRQPEPYKGKGIRYFGERVRKKAGKAGRI